MIKKNKLKKGQKRRDAKNHKKKKLRDKKMKTKRAAHLEERKQEREIEKLKHMYREKLTPIRNIGNKAQKDND